MKIGKKTVPTSKSIQVNSLRESPEKSLRTQLSEHLAIAELKKDHVNEENLVQKERVLKSRKSPKNSLFKLRRRPAFGVGSKSPVCRIINCRRNKNHKCCQEQENQKSEITDVTTEKTTEKTTTESVTALPEKMEDMTTQITEDGTTEDGTTDDGTTDYGTTEDGTTEDGTTEHGTTEHGTTEDGTTEDGTTEDGATEDGTTEVGTTKQEEEITKVTWTENTKAFTSEYVEFVEADNTTLGSLPEQASKVIAESYDSENNEERAVVTQEASISSVETRVVQATAFRVEEIDKGYTTITENPQVG